MNSSPLRSCLALLLATGCPGNGVIDAGLDARLMERDVSASDVNASEAGVDATSPTVDAREVDARASDGGPRDAGPQDAGLAGTRVAMSYRGHTGTFDRAFMGYQREGSTIVALYFELSRGADDTCPSETSPTPQQVITLDAYGSNTAGVDADGIAVQFFDFEGHFRGELRPDTTPTATRITVTAIDLAAGTAAGSVDLTFADGTASGPFQAVHCASLDTSR